MLRVFTIIAAALFLVSTLYVPVHGLAAVDAVICRELRPDPPLVLNAWRELAAAKVASLPAFRVDTRGMRTVLMQAGISQPVTIDIHVPGMRKRVHPQPLALDSPDFPAQVRWVIVHKGEGDQAEALPGECVLWVRDAAEKPLARINARFHLYASPDITKFKTLPDLVRKGGATPAVFWCTKQRKRIRTDCFDALGWILFHHNAYANAAEYWGLCESAKRSAGFQALGDVELHNRRYHEAMVWYDRAGPSGNRARTCGILADLEWRQGNTGVSGEWLERAVAEYDGLIKSPVFSWKELDVRDRLRRLNQWHDRPGSTTEKEVDARLKSILARCDAYCRRLFHSSFDFVCIEEERQKMGGGGAPVNYMLLSLKQPREAGTVTYEYDYRLVRKNLKIREVRTRIRCNGRRVDEKVVDPPVDHPGVEKIIFGPLAMFERRWQWRFRYRILGEESLWGEKTVVLDVIPRGRPGKNRFFGKVWVREKDGSVMKIAFNPKSLVNFELVRSLVAGKGGVPDMVIVAEYREMRRGIRFPSRYFFEDAYVNPGGKRVLRFRSDHRYRDYRFFSISSSVKYRP